MMTTNEENIPFWINFGNTVRRLRKNTGISQEQLALSTEIDRRYLSDVEQGRRNVSLNLIARIAEFFDLSASSLIAEAERYKTQRFSNLEELKNEICLRGYDDYVVLENPDYITAVAGISEEGRLIYDYTRMVDFLVAEDGMSQEEAMEFIDYNTIRALPYMGPLAPVILYPI